MFRGMMRSTVMVALLVFGVPVGIAAAAELNLQPNVPVWNVTPLLEYTERPASGTTTDSPPPPEQENFKLLAQPCIRFGLTDRSTEFWFRFTLNNPFDAQQRFFLEVDNPRFNSVTCYISNPAGGFSTSHVGTDYPFREYVHPWSRPTFRIVAPPHDQLTVYLRILNKGVLQTHVSLWETRAFNEHITQWALMCGLFYGMLIVMALANGIVAIRLRDRLFFYHTIFVLACLGYELSFHGIGQQYLWPNARWWTDRSYFVFAGFAMSLALVFTRLFLNTVQLTPRLDKLIIALAAASLAIPAGKMADISWINAYAHLMSFVVAPVLILAGAIGVKKGYRPAWTFLTGWGIMLVGSILIDLWGLALIPDFIVFKNLFHVGFVFIPLIQSIALVDRVRFLEERNQQELERQVAQRTEELQEALDNVKTLRGFIPICARCKKIRDDKGFWNNIEAYLRQHSDADFTHGICPDCMRILYGQEFGEIAVSGEKKPQSTWDESQ